MIRRPSLLRDRRGVSVTEFGFVAPVLCLFLVGAFDLAHTLYMESVLQGIVQKTARDSALESGTVAAQQQKTDDKVRGQVWALARNATITFNRRFYRTFAAASAAKPENWTDTNGNGVCDNGEPYVDANNNNSWDADGGDAGQGGAQDKTIYTVTVTYPHMLPVMNFIGLGKNVTLVAKTVLQNQPYADQGSYTTTNTVRNCPLVQPIAPASTSSF